MVSYCKIELFWTDCSRAWNYENVKRDEFARELTRSEGNQGDTGIKKSRWVALDAGFDGRAGFESRGATMKLLGCRKENQSLHQLDRTQNIIKGPTRPAGYDFRPHFLGDNITLVQ